MRLVGKRVILEPLLDIEYLLDLVDKDNNYKYPREEIANMVKDYGCEFWEIMLNNTRRGVVGYFKINEIYVLEALKDKSQPATGIGYSVEVGNLVLDYMFTFMNKVRTMAKEADKSIQILIKKLGFKQIDTKDNLIIYEKER